MPETWRSDRQRVWLPRGFVRQAGSSYAGKYFGYETEDFSPDGWLTFKTEQVDPFEFVVIRRTGVVAANRLSMPHRSCELPEEALPDDLISANQMAIAREVSSDIVHQNWFGIYSLARWLKRTYNERYDW